ncbi:styrene monooxygenase/indole monooxygenase family protein [Paenibacillus sp. GCM10023252]|uniref:styrene monooxygenase/indole monooxygenase family protein n=1 Tax=Paenibacillus sp. GCM10023252 TaxID=3252649 RepID=UPI0036083991
MKRRIGLIGSGTAALQLAYALKDVHEVTIVHAQDHDEVLRGRVRSTQVHFGPARARERRLGMPEVGEAPSINFIHFSLGSQKLFAGALAEPASSVDQRLFYSIAMKELAEDGVIFRKQRAQREELDALAAEFELLIDATGKSGPIAPFEVDEELSTVNAPLRKCAVGYFQGVAPVQPGGVSITVLPGVGEMFEIPTLTEHGPSTILFVEAVPDGELDVFRGVKSAAAFTEQMANVVALNCPEILSRIDLEQFALVDEEAYLLTAITPAAYRPYVTVGDGTLVLGCGDNVLLNDPITGQGCNTASYMAEQLVQTLEDYRDKEWTEELGAEYWERTRPYAEAVTGWTNAMMSPLPAHVGQMLMQAAGNQAAADCIAAWFSNPALGYEAFYPGKAAST